MAGSLQDSHIIYVEWVYLFVGIPGILKEFGAAIYKIIVFCDSLHKAMAINDYDLFFF